MIKKNTIPLLNSKQKSKAVLLRKIKPKKTANPKATLRIININGKRYIQTINFVLEKNRYEIELLNSQKEKIGEMRVNLRKTGNFLDAFIDWPSIVENERVSGLYSKMLENVLKILKKKGVSYVQAKSVLMGHKTYKKLGFTVLSRFGETEVYKKL